MPESEREKALIEGFFAILRGGDSNSLALLVTEDCSDADPLPFQLAGRAGVAQKIRMFRAAHPDARIVIESIERAPSGARATWTTTAQNLGGAAGEATWRFTALFEIEEGESGKIKSSRVERSGAL